MIRILMVSLAVLSCLTACCPNSTESVAGDTTIWPGESWEYSSPGAEGLDAAAIEILDQEFRAGKHGYVDSMVLIRNGRIVFEAYYEQDYAEIKSEYDTSAPAPWNYFDANYYPYYQGSDLHSLQSATKSFMSALVGIAIERGDISGIDATLGELLPHRGITDPQKSAISLENILTMTPGFEWNEDISYFDPLNDATIVEGTDDWVGYLLGKPIAAPQGDVYNYNSTNTQLMSEMLSVATGMPLDEYAEKYLFGPIGIDDYLWNDTPEGYKNAGGGLFLNSRDLARFALLFARNGEWNGEQVIPAEWVTKSGTPWVPDTYPGDPEFDVGYGYQWWIYEQPGEQNPGMYGGWGWGGQFPLIVPELDLVAVFTAWNIYEEQDYEDAYRLFYDRVVMTAEDLAQ